MYIRKVRVELFRHTFLSPVVIKKTLSYHEYSTTDIEKYSQVKDFSLFLAQNNAFIHTSRQTYLRIYFILNQIRWLIIYNNENC